MGNDARPYERYEEYMKRRMREEDEKTIKWQDHTQTTEELYRQNVLHLTQEVAIMKNNVRELQEQLQNAYKRIKELVEERDEAKNQALSKEHDA